MSNTDWLSGDRFGPKVGGDQAEYRPLHVANMDVRASKISTCLRSLLEHDGCLQSLAEQTEGNPTTIIAGATAS